ncbi:hypothetical protein [Sporosarcina limicola]|uniref:Spore coat protein n=1 Tax=Sporosarcina limicola TaxID=34101 RepID=A0A927MMZ5_9BACL|nr:hypothetical protein [Sporosarcina limicola]MBE1556933.1 hypothetical protein [Sporosarcina limicola]
MLIILKNEPLLFIQGPPVFHKVFVHFEESTSIYLLNGEGSEEPEEKEQGEQVRFELGVEDTSLVKGTNQSVIRRITYLGTPFSRQVYHPLQFVLGDRTLTGTIEKIEGETVLIGTNEGEKEIIAVEMARIEEILWRGNPFDGN